MKIAQKIRQLRLDRKMTLKEMAKYLDVPVSTYRDWEYGRRMPAEAILKLSEVFGVPMMVFTKRELPGAALQRAAYLMEEALRIVRNAV
jgi:transcriptional regulator with XRE-family HTH domain